jgi:hypothetical protein
MAEVGEHEAPITIATRLFGVIEWWPFSSTSACVEARGVRGTEALGCCGAGNQDKVRGLRAHQLIVESGYISLCL